MYIKFKSGEVISTPSIQIHGDTICWAISTEEDKYQELTSEVLVITDTNPNP